MILNASFIMFRARFHLLRSTEHAMTPGFRTALPRFPPAIIREICQSPACIYKADSITHLTDCLVHRGCHLTDLLAGLLQVAHGVVHPHLLLVLQEPHIPCVKRPWDLRQNQKQNLRKKTAQKRLEMRWKSDWETVNGRTPAPAGRQRLPADISRTAWVTHPAACLKGREISQKIMHSGFKMMNSGFEMMSFVIKAMDFVLKHE